MTKFWTRVVSTDLRALACNRGHAAGLVGSTLPDGFPSIEDASLGKPLIGFGAAGPVTRTPVIFIHGTTTRRFRPRANPPTSRAARR